MQKLKFYDNSVVFDALYLFQVLLSLLGFFLLGFPPTLAYKDHPTDIGVKIFSMVQGEFVITSKETSLEAVVVPGYCSLKSFRIDPIDCKGILLILISLGFVLIICISNEK